MHGQKWERGRHLVLCKAKAVWLETSAASDPELHDEEKRCPTRCFPVKGASLNWLEAYLQAPLLLPTPCSSFSTICGPALFVRWSQASPGNWEMGLQHRVQEPRERAALCGCKYSILCLCPDQGTNKEQRCQRNKELGAPAHIHAQVVHGSPGVTRIISTPLAMSLLRPSSIHSCPFGTTAPSVQAGRDTVKNQRLGRGIWNEVGGGGAFKYLHDDDDDNNNNRTLNTVFLVHTRKDLWTCELYMFYRWSKEAAGQRVR